MTVRILSMQLKTIAHIRNMYKEKFGIPRQSGMTDMVSQIVFEKDFRDINALRGLDGFSHLWLIWGFSEVDSKAASKGAFRPTVRPPRLGGNTRVGVFATRSPFRPNPLGLSCVRLKQIKETEEGPVIEVIGADLLDGTPIYDIKPYLAQFDSHSEAKSGFVDENEFRVLKVVITDEQKAILGSDAEIIEQTLSQDPRPQYQDDPDRVYGIKFADYEIRFTVRKDVLKVLEVSREEK